MRVRDYIHLVSALGRNVVNVMRRVCVVESARPYLGGPRGPPSRGGAECVRSALGREGRRVKLVFP